MSLSGVNTGPQEAIAFVMWHGLSAVEAFYESADGRAGMQLLNWHDETKGFAGFSWRTSEVKSGPPIPDPLQRVEAAFLLLATRDWLSLSRVPMGSGRQLRIGAEGS